MSVVDNISSKIGEIASRIKEHVQSSPKAEQSSPRPSTGRDSVDLSSAAAEQTKLMGGTGEDVIAESAGHRSGTEAKEVPASSDGLSDDVKDLASRMLESSDIDNPINENSGDTLDDITVLQASGKDDQINITAGDNGGIIVSVNGEEYSYTRNEAESLIIDAGAGIDNVHVDDSVTNELYITGGKGNDNLEGGKGNDTIVDNQDSNVINGDEGNDTLIANGNSSKGFFSKLWDNITGNKPSNVIAGGEGDDYIEGGFGNDSVSGGDGDDYIYGLSGDDKLSGGEGNDYIDGGKGDDTISGADGNDKLFGGKGNDTISGSDGDDVITGGKGHDTVSGGDGADHITTVASSAHSDVVGSDDADTVDSVANMTIPGDISVQGTAAFKERVESDLEMMTSNKVGQQMLDALDHDGHLLKIVRTDAGNECRSYTSGHIVYDDDNNVVGNGLGAGSTIGYDTTYHNMYSDRETWSEVAPSNVLFHEMAHAYNYAEGTNDPVVYDNYTDEHLYNADGTYSRDKNQGVAGAEYQAVGDIGYLGQENPEGVTENAMRDYLGYEKREYYWQTPYQARIDAAKKSQE